MRKHLTAEAEQWCRERIGQHNDNLKLWESGYLTATEPEQEEREITVCQLRSARDELISLLCLFCGAVKADLERLTLKEAMGLVVNVPEDKMTDDNTTRMSDEEISDALADLSGERYNPHVRLDEPGEDDCVVERIERIEMDFAIPVYLTHRHQQMLHDFAKDICDYPPNIPLAGVHWPSGYGSKPRWSKADVRFLGKDAKQIDPDAPEDGEPMFDDTVLFLETSARGFVSDEERKRKVEARVQPGAASKSDSVVESEQQVVLTCVYCGHAYPPGTPAAMHPILTEHITQCEKHPMRAVVQERDELRDELAEAKRDAANWKRSFEAQNGEMRRLSDEREDLDERI